MQVIGCTFTKIAAERSLSFKSNSSINTDIEFTEVNKEEMPLLKEAQALKINFKFGISYSTTPDKKGEKNGEVVFEGNILLSATKDEVKDLLKSWKKKEIPAPVRVPLLNFILKKCSAKALDLEEQLNLPPHIPFPLVKLQPKEEKSQS